MAGATQPNIANDFSLLFGMLYSWRCVGNILSEKRNIFSLRPRLSAKTGALTVFDSRLYFQTSQFDYVYNSVTASVDRLRELEKKVGRLRRTYGPKKEKIAEESNDIMRCFKICTLQDILCR